MSDCTSRLTPVITLLMYYKNASMCRFPQPILVRLQTSFWRIKYTKIFASSIFIFWYSNLDIMSFPVHIRPGLFGKFEHEGLYHITSQSLFEVSTILYWNSCITHSKHMCEVILIVLARQLLKWAIIAFQSFKGTIETRCVFQKNVCLRVLLVFSFFSKSTPICKDKFRMVCSHFWFFAY